MTHRFSHCVLMGANLTCHSECFSDRYDLSTYLAKMKMFFSSYYYYYYYFKLFHRLQASPFGQKQTRARAPASLFLNRCWLVRSYSDQMNMIQMGTVFKMHLWGFRLAALWCKVGANKGRFVVVLRLKVPFAFRNILLNKVWILWFLSDESFSAVSPWWAAPLEAREPPSILMHWKHCVMWVGG